jgi:hypothetical protein
MVSALYAKQIENTSSEICLRIQLRLCSSESGYFIFFKGPSGQIRVEPESVTLGQICKPSIAICY